MELSVCLEELMDTPTFKRFNTALDGVLEAAEDMDLASIRGVYVVLCLAVHFFLIGDVWLLSLCWHSVEYRAQE